MQYASTGTDGKLAPEDIVNKARITRAAAVLLGRGSSIPAVHIRCIDSNGSPVLEMIQGSLAAAPAVVSVTDDVLSTLQAAFTREISSKVAEAGAVGFDVASTTKVAVTQEADGGRWAQIMLSFADKADAVAAMNGSLIQQLVQTSAAIQSPTRVQMVRLTISDATGQVLLDYAEDLSTGSVSAYHTSGMGDGWTKHPGRADMKGAELQE